MKEIYNIIKIFLGFSFLFFFSANELKAQCRDNATKVDNPEFINKKYYPQIFNEAARADLSNLKQQIKKAEITLTEAAILNNDVNELYKKAEKETNKRAKRKLYSEIDKKRESAQKTEIAALNQFNESRSKQYSIYSSNIEEARYKSKVRNTREARDYEYDAKTLEKNAQRYRKNAEGKPISDIIKDYTLADSLQQKAINNLENAFSAYNEDSPKKNENLANDIDEYNKFIEEENKKYQAEIDALLKGRSADPWMRKIDYEYTSYEKNVKKIEVEQQKIKEYQILKAKLQTQEKKEKEIRTLNSKIKRSGDYIKKYKKDIRRYEKQIISLLKVKINDDKQVNQQKFEDYNEGFARYDRRKNESKVIKAEREILKHLNTAKEYIYKAEFTNQCAKARLKIYTYLLQAKFHQAEAMDQLVGIKRDFGNLFYIDGTEIKKTCTSSINANSGSKTTSKKKTGTSNSGSTKKTYTNKSTGSNWKYANKKGIKYKVQIIAQTNVPASSAFKGLYPISSEKLGESTLTAYLVGSTTSMFTAEKTLKKAKQKGFQDAYIVAYKNGERIALWEAEDIIKGIKKETTKSTKHTTSSTVTTTSATEKIKAKSLKNIEGIVYTIQVAYSKNTPTSQELRYLTPVYAYKFSDGYSKYSVGLFRDFSSADKESTNIKNKGIRDAFVVAFENGKPIDLNKAIQKQKR